MSINRSRWLALSAVQSALVLLAYGASPVCVAADSVDPKDKNLVPVAACQPSPVIEYTDFDETVQRLTRLYVTERFGELDAALSCLMHPASRFKSGKMGASAVYWMFRRQLPGSGVNPAEAQRIRQWREKAPDSIFAEFADIRLMYAMAWSARGTRPARDVSDSGVKLFNDGLLAAERALMSARPALQGTAIWKNLLLATVLDSRQTKQDAGQIFAEGVKQWPGYYDFYELVLTRLVPSWGGSWDTVDQFIVSWADRLRATEGDSVYARFYSSIVLEGYNPYATKISWPHMKRSLDDLNKRYPDLAFKNTAASFGCVYTDNAYYQVWIKQIESHQLLRSVWVPGIRPEDCTKPLIRF